MIQKPNSSPPNPTDMARLALVAGMAVGMTSVGVLDGRAVPGRRCVTRGGRWFRAEPTAPRSRADALTETGAAPGDMALIDNRLTNGVADARDKKRCRGRRS